MASSAHRQPVSLATSSRAAAAGALGCSTSVRWTRRGGGEPDTGRARQRGGEGEGQRRQSVPCGNERPQAVHIGSAVRDAWAEPVGVGGGAQLAERDGGVGGVDPVGVGEVEEAQGAPVGQRVTRGQEHGEGLFGHGQAGQGRRVGHRKRVAGGCRAVDQAQVRGAGEHRSGHRRPSEHLDVHRESGGVGAQPGQLPGDGGREGRGAAGEGQPGRGRPAGSGDVCAGGVEAEQQWRGVLHEPFARRGRPDGTALHQSGAEIVLQGRDVLGHGGLGVAQRLGRGGEGAVLDDGDEGAQQMRIHEYQYL